MRLGNDDELGFGQAEGETGATDLELDGTAEGSASEHGACGSRDEPHVDEAFSDLSTHAERIDHEGQTVMNLVEGHGQKSGVRKLGERDLLGIV
jgi:hypothetical protein